MNMPVEERGMYEHEEEESVLQSTGDVKIQKTFIIENTLLKHTL